LSEQNAHSQTAKVTDAKSNYVFQQKNLKNLSAKNSLSFITVWFRF